MSIIAVGHGDSISKSKTATRANNRSFAEATAPVDGDISVNEHADFGYLYPEFDKAGSYLPGDSADELDQLGNLMVPDADPAHTQVTPDSGSLPPVLTYFGQFLDHELTARTDRKTDISQIDPTDQTHSAEDIERLLKNARTPRFDLDSVYGGLPVGPDMPKEAAIVISGLRFPKDPDMMRVGWGVDPGPLPDDLDKNRDLPRFSQAEPKVRDAYEALARQTLEGEKLDKFLEGIDKRALIGDMRNDENLIVAQFHLSFLRFHNRAVMFLRDNDTGWRGDFASAKALTTLHYQFLIVSEYLRKICDKKVLDKVIHTRASHFFKFRNDYANRNGYKILGNALPLEFSVAAFRFGHTMVRDAYDYNKNFGRDNGNPGSASFRNMFLFTGGGGFRGLERLPKNWIADWNRLLGLEGKDDSDGAPAQFARAIDTQIAPPLGDMENEGKDHPEGSDARALFRHLARRNLRRGLNLRMPTGQALHRYLNDEGALDAPVANDITTKISSRTEMVDFMCNSDAKLHENTPLWFYCLAEAEGAGGEKLGPLGSWIVASTFIGALLSDPESALSRGFVPTDSPLKTPDGDPIASLADWMRFALVME